MRLLLLLLLLLLWGDGEATGLGRDASLRFLSFATVKCGGRDPFAFEEWQCGCPSGNVVGTWRFCNGVKRLATDGCFGIAPSAVEGGRSPFRISAKLLVVGGGGPPVLGTTGSEDWPVSIIRICEKLCVVVVLAFTPIPCGDLRLIDICIRQVSTAVPRWVVG